MDAHDFQGPLKMISPGRVFRRDYGRCDRSPIPPNRRIGCWEKHLYGRPSGTLQLIVQRCLVKASNSLRPSYFPFTGHLLKWMFPASVVEKAVTYVENRLDRNHGCRYGSPTCS